MIDFEVGDEEVIVILKKLVEILDDVREGEFALIDLIFIFESEDSQVKEIVLGDEFVEQIFLAV